MEWLEQSLVLTGKIDNDFIVSEVFMKLREEIVDIDSSLNNH